jgi:hypothetical protein
VTAAASITQSSTVSLVCGISSSTVPNQTVRLTQENEVRDHVAAGAGLSPKVHPALLSVPAGSDVCSPSPRGGEQRASKKRSFSLCADIMGDLVDFTEKPMYDKPSDLS